MAIAAQRMAESNAQRARSSQIPPGPLLALYGARHLRCFHTMRLALLSHDVSRHKAGAETPFWLRLALTPGVVRVIIKGMARVDLGKLVLGFQ